ncbi:MAG: MFS transporter [Chloroflexi bacterium]|nr:MFS transporter [Chloroflexota bacterium]
MAEIAGTRAETRKIWGVHPNVFFLGLTSFFTDLSSELVFTLVPLFLANVLRAPTAIIGLVGGLSDSTEAVFKIFSGRLSDRIHRPKLLTVLGYGLATVAKPFMLLAGNWGVVAAVRFSDRVGKGIRVAPRDALVADSISAGDRGRAFGMRQAMDTAGAAMGLIAAALIIYLVQGSTAIELGLGSYRWMIAFGTIPAVVAVVILAVFVKEKKRPAQASAGQQGGRPVIAPPVPFDIRFKIFLAVVTIFMLGNSSDFFVILRAQNLHVPLVQVVGMLVLFNIVYALSALPMGILSDRLGRKRIIIIGWLIYALTYLGFALAGEIWQSWVLFAGYGLYYGAFEGVARALVADLVPSERRGTAYGLYNGVVSAALLPASLIAGWMWDAISPQAPFYFGAGLAFLAMLGILALVREPAATAKPA